MAEAFLKAPQLVVDNMVVIAVIIPTFNRRETLLMALKKIFEALPPNDFAVVVDSGSSDGTSEMVSREFPQVTLIQGDSSMWWATATNLGIRKARKLGCSHVLTYNEDNIATPGLFTALAQAAHLHPDSAIAAVCCYLDRPNTVFFAGRMRAKHSDRFYYLNHNTPLSDLDGSIREVNLLHGMCTLFPVSIFDSVGLFDESSFPQIFADDDLTLRASKRGYRLRVALNAVVLNDRSKTGFNPYDRRIGPLGLWRLLFSRKSAFEIAGRTRFLWRHRRSFWYFCKTWLYDYTRLLCLVSARWLLPENVFRWLAKRHIHQLQEQ